MSDCFVSFGRCRADAGDGPGIRTLPTASSECFAASAVGRRWYFGMKGQRTGSARMSATTEAVGANPRLDRLYELSLAAGGDPSAVCGRILCLIGEVFDVEAVCLAEVEGDELQFRYVCIAGEIREMFDRCPLSVMPSVGRGDDPLPRVVHDAATRFSEAAVLQTFKARTYCGVAARDDHGVLVALMCLIDRRVRDHLPEDLERLVPLGARIGRETVLQRRQAAIGSGHALARAVFDHSSEGIFVTDADDRILAVNTALCRITGYAEDELIGQRPSIWKSGHHDGEFFRSLSEALKRDGRWQGEIWNRKKSGEVIPTLENISRIPPSEAGIGSYVALMTDISNMKAYEDRLSHLAHHDPLTGLANRALLVDRLGHAIQKARRQKTSLAVMFLDLDHFKQINDSFGHATGDQVLKEVAARLSSAVRASDTVARLGGDEFVMVVGELENPERAGAIAAKLLKSISAPMQIEGREFLVTPSLGVAMYPQDGDSLTALMANADTAMYHAKKLGRNTWQFYSQSLGSRVCENLVFENALRSAEERGELSLHYQPQFDVASGRLVGAEALIRWTHPEFGVVAPARFIPLAEESGLIIKLGDWVLSTACRQMQAWRRAGIAPGRISVNVSALQIRRGNVAETLAETLSRTGLAPGALELEVTESFLLEAGRSMTAIQALRDLGVEFAIDDFGTSYSSLKYLQHLPIRRLKIDHSFVRSIPEDPDSAAIARAVIALADSMQLSVVAEGVETARQREFLSAAGCDIAQGYLFGAPAGHEEFERLYLSPLR
jgi:diguanylate cyclase (GGDEF)-like protein/PAS domain S-box-containing protein